MIFPFFPDILIFLNFRVPQNFWMCRFSQTSYAIRAQNPQHVRKLVETHSA